MVSSRRGPPGPNMSSSWGRTPCLAMTAWTSAFSPERRATNFALYLTSSLSSRTSGGALSTPRAGGAYGAGRPGQWRQQVVLYPPGPTWANTASTRSRDLRWPPSSPGSTVIVDVGQARAVREARRRVGTGCLAQQGGAKARRPRRPVPAIRSRTLLRLERRGGYLPVAGGAVGCSVVSGRPSEDRYPGSSRAADQFALGPVVFYLPLPSVEPIMKWAG